METNARAASRRDRYLANPSRALWTLAIPVMAGMSIQIMYSIADLIFIGRISAQALSAVAFNIPLFFLVLSLTMGLGSGVTAVIARYVGAADKANADNSALHGLLIGVVVSAFLAGIGLGYGRGLLRLIGTPEEILELAWSYLQILSLGIPFLVLSSSFGSILAGEGDTRFPMMVSGLGTLTNIGLDPVCIFVLDLGLRGAAVATALSQAMVFVIFVYLLLGKKRSYISFQWHNFHFAWSLLKEIITIGLPASGSMLIMSFGSAVFNRILSHYSAQAVAAYQIAGRMDMLILLPIIAIASALVTLVGMFWGAKEMAKLRFIIRYGTRWAVTITLVGAVLIYSFAPTIVRFFTDDAEILRIAVGYLRIIAFAYPFIAIAITSGRSLQGLGKGTPMLIITSVRILLVSAPLASLMAFVFQKPIEWVWYSLLCSVLASVTIAVLWLRSALQEVLRTSTSPVAQ
ncbi:MAG: MATE family efflux transporter [Nitrospinota bacterium]|nr:MAG: MATE family efflux transporter [Nitrospinota bacterium]